MISKNIKRVINQITNGIYIGNSTCKSVMRGSRKGDTKDARRTSNGVRRNATMTFRASANKSEKIFIYE